MLPKAIGLKGIALDFLFPRMCVGCGREGAFICSSCLALLKPIIPPICPLCGSPTSDGGRCSSCSSWKAAVDGIRSPFRYEGVIRQAIHELKYNNLRALAPTLAGLLSEYLAGGGVWGDVLVPVPLHPRRLRERGYNQSALLVEELAGLTGLNMMSGVLSRTRYSSPQARSAGVKERGENVDGAFAAYGDEIRGRRVIVVDDVATSGATLNSCVVALKAGGAASVWGLTLARDI